MIDAPFQANPKVSAGNESDLSIEFRHFVSSGVLDAMRQDDRPDSYDTAHSVLEHQPSEIASEPLPERFLEHILIERIVDACLVEGSAGQDRPGSILQCRNRHAEQCRAQ